MSTTDAMFPTVNTQVVVLAHMQCLALLLNYNEVMYDTPNIPGYSIHLFTMASNHFRKLCTEEMSQL